MKFYDVFNGDADGLCALVQLRLANPSESIPVSGVKRDIRLLDRVQAERGDDITVCDISLDANREALERVLQQGASVRWFDHHYPGEIPARPGFIAHIDTNPGVCSSLIVDHYLGGMFRNWAIVAAFGDNLDHTARRLAADVGLNDKETALLRRLGVAINYNAYGETLEDLLYSPVDLFGQMKSVTDPLEFARSGKIFPSLVDRMDDDMARASAIPVRAIAPGSAYALLPRADWSRRVVGVYANSLARSQPDTAHAILVERDGGYVVSIRAPVATPRDAAAVARAFRSGGGREGAAGIDVLPPAELDRFLALMRDTYPGKA